MLGTKTGFFSCVDFSARTNKLPQKFGVFVINHTSISRAKEALFFFLLNHVLVDSLYELTTTYNLIPRKVYPSHLSPPRPLEVLL